MDERPQRSYAGLAIFLIFVKLAIGAILPVFYQ
jgi:hypothetical protein